MNMLTTAEPGALIVVAALMLLAAAIAEETVRRRLKSRKLDRLRAAKIREDALMASRAHSAHTSFVRAAVADVERHDAAEVAGGWPTLDDLAAVISDSGTDTDVRVPSPRTTLYAVPELTEASA